MNAKSRSSCAALVVALLSGAPAARAQPIVVDGQIDVAYGSPLASDPLADYVGFPAWDLGALYVAHDADHLYVAFAIAGDVSSEPDGKYVLYIDTTGDGAGATSDPWMRAVTVADPHKPELSINTWLDSPPYDAADVELWSWSGGGGWTNQGTVTEAALSSGPGGSTVEWKIARSALGGAQQIWLEVWSSGENPGDNAQDTINAPADDYNAPSGTAQWSDPSTLSCSTVYSLAASPPADAGPPPPDAALPPDTSIPPPPPDASVVPDTTHPWPVDAAVDVAADVDAEPGFDGAPAADASAAGDVAAAADGTTPSGDAGAGDGGVASARQDEGCGCGAAASGSSSSALALPLTLIVLCGGGRRRRRPSSASAKTRLRPPSSAGSRVVSHEQPSSLPVELPSPPMPPSEGGRPPSGMAGASMAQ